MDSIGDTLRSERLRRSLGLEQVAAQTKIGRQYLQAMEANEFDRLPTGLFTRSFLRQYARTLELDEEDVLASYRLEFEEPALPLPLPHQKRRWSVPLLPAFGWFLAAMFVTGAVYTLWQNVRRSLPETKASSVQHASANSDLGFLVGKSFESIPSTHLDAQPTPASGGVKPLPTEQDAANMHVTFKATESVWLSVQSDGTQVFSGTLMQQEDKQFDASRDMTALVGNAGGLQVSLNGKPVGPIGPEGEVRTVKITPAGAHIQRHVAPNNATSEPPGPDEDR